MNKYGLPLPANHIDIISIQQIMAEIGKLNNLIALKKVEFGVYFDGEELGEILLPKKYVPKDLNTDDVIEVFIYRDSENRLIATTEKPIAVVGEFAFLKVVSVTKFGAFLDWGLPKNLMVPFREQKKILEEGRSYVVSIYLDEKSQRITASTKLDQFLDLKPIKFKEGDEVDLLIYEKTNIGYKAIIEGTHSGILYENEVFQTIEIGQQIKGYIRKIREDQKIDLRLQKSGIENISEVMDEILAKLKEQNGFIPANDRSPPEVISEIFGISKKTFKKSIGALYKKRLIIMDDEGVKLTK